MILLILRAVFLFLSIGIASSILFFLFDRQAYVLGTISFVIVMAIAIAVLAGDVMAKNKQITSISSVFFGLLMGFLLASLFWQALQPIVREYLGVQAVSSTRPEQMIQLLLTIITCYISVSILFQTKEDFRFIIPYVEFSKQLKGAKPLVLDTSVIIDGRIADICDTGIIDTKLIVPRFVLQELQGIADSSDKIKRNRGRRGLDVLKKMQSNTKVEVQMHEANIAELREVLKVDERLVVLAKVLSARVVTNDFNLNKIAQIQGVDVINLNELANALKLVALPGEILFVKIVKQGDQIGQGVGYLDDGTMVVVEQGRSALGQEVNITVTSVLQTPAGRMIFGRIEARPFVSTAVAAGAAPAQPPA
ncbi:MAG: TRAM domain-containing protein [Gemmataceae bacterium]|nr:TRAM domain-containing protein [Gemmataceae bacterium]